MKIEFSDHAITQLANRTRITMKMVVQTIQSPEETDNSYRSRTVYRKSFSGDFLEVVTVKEDDTIVVITGYFLDKL